MHRAPLSVGPFDLLNRVGHGGYGQVWQGVHRGRERTPVAVKLLRARPAQGSLDAFRAEAERWARLDHPAIVQLFDQGTVGEGDPGGLAPDTPYLVMEYAGGGSLAAHLEFPVPWERLREDLSAILDALAHAHAHGVIHRDLKPANLLVHSSADIRPGLKLTDFGTAYLWRDGEAFAAERTGSPAYMAPEQWSGNLALQGPWTDLYALGCIATELGTGHPPFGRPTRQQDVARLSEAHCTLTPALLEDAPYPMAFARWVRKLLEKRPANRFLDAPEARASLMAIGKASSMVGWDSRTFSRSELPEAPIAPPSTWRGPETAPRTIRLMDAGLGLYGMRRARFVGREVERDELWGQLLRCVEEGRPRAIAIRGATGSGRTRTALWLAERAAELGIAHTLARPASAGGRASDGVEGLLAGLLRVAGLPTVKAREQLETVFAGRDLGSPAEAHALAEVLAPRAGRERPAIGTTADTVRGFLVRLSRHHPVVLVLDDAHRSPSAIDFLKRLLDSQPELSLLVVVTVDDDQLEALPEGPRTEVNALLGHPLVRSISLGPLSGDEVRLLVSSLVTLAPEGLARLTEQTGGNPLFVEEVVGGWIDEGYLRAGPAGFTLAPEALTTLPDRLYELWPARIGRAIEGLGASVGDALVVAGALGVQVPRLVWMAACARLGVEPADALVDRLVRAGLAFRTEEGWAFTHEMIRGALQRRAEERQVWADVNSACADALTMSANTPRRNERIGRHLVAAGRGDQALSVLLEAVDEALVRSHVWEARAILDLRDQAAAVGAGSDGAAARLEGGLRRARIAMLVGDFDGAEQTAREVAAEAGERGFEVLHGQALYLRAQRAEKRRDVDVADALYHFVARVASSDRALCAACLEHRGTVARMRHRYDDSLALLTEARLANEALGSLQGVAQCWKELAGTLVERIPWHTRAHDAKAAALDATAAAAALDEAEGLFRQLGDAAGRADVLNNLGDLQRGRGELGEARRSYRAAIDLLQGLGSGRIDIPITNLGMVLLLFGEFDEAAACFDKTLASGRLWLAPYARLGRATCDAERGLWSEAIRRYEELAPHGRIPLGEADLLWLGTALWAAARRGRKSANFPGLKASIDAAGSRS